MTFSWAHLCHPLRGKQVHGGATLAVDTDGGGLENFLPEPGVGSAGCIVTFLQGGVGLGGLYNFPDTKSLLRYRNLGVPIVAHWNESVLYP